LKDKLEWDKILDLEVFDDALSCAIKNIGVEIFKSMTRGVPNPNLLGFVVLGIGYSFGFWFLGQFWVWVVWVLGQFWVWFWDLGFASSLEL
jgi:hypothetical protein